MLPATFRFVAINRTGQSQTTAGGAAMSVEYKLWKFDSGAVSWSAEDTDDLTHEATSVDNAVLNGSTVDNSTNLYMGLRGRFEVTTDHASSDGVWQLFLDTSTDGGTDWASDNVSDPDTDEEAGIAMQLVGQTQTIDGAMTVAFDFEL